MIALTQEVGIPQFDRMQRHSSVSTISATAVAHSGGPGRPRGQRKLALSWTAANTMAALRSLGAIACIVATFATPMLLSVAAHAAHRANGLSANPFAAFVAEASRRFAVPEHWIRSVMRVESGGKVRARSQKGAMGLMQIMPQTWSELRVRYDLGADPYDPRDNILAGAAYLREMHDRYGAAGFLAAYNAGPGRYAEYLATGRPLPAETLAYVAALAPLIGGDPVNCGVVVAIGPNAWIRAPLFAVVADSTSSAHQPQSDGPLHARPVADLSGLEPPHDWHSRDMLRGASLFFARTSSGPPR